MFPVVLLSQEEEAESTSFFGTMFISHGIQLAFTNYFTTPEYSYDQDLFFDTGDLYQTNKIVAASSGTNIFTYEFGLRKNLFEVSDDAALSLGIYPAVSLSALFSKVSTLYGIGGLKLPIFLEYNMGVGSTIYTEMVKGSAFGVGVDLRYTPLYSFGTTSGEASAPKNIDVQSKYFLIALKYSYRMYSKKGNLNEITAMVGASLTPYDSALGYIGEITVVERPVSFELTFSRFIKY